MDEVILDGGPLSIEDVVRAANGTQVSVAEKGRSAALESRSTLELLERGDETIYGVNTGFGALKSVRVAPEDAVKLQRNLIRSHAAGVGAPLGVLETRAAMTLLAASHLRGASGIGPEAAELIVQLLNRHLTPSIPSRGSLGASGDLAPLAHLAMALIGEAPVFNMDGKGAHLGDLGLPPLQLVSKAGLSLINGTHVHTGMGALLVQRAGTLAKVADIACAMAVEAMLCSNQPFRSDVHGLRPHQGQAQSAANVMNLTHGSALILSHANCGEVQDAYSIRCAPQVHGAARQTISHARDVIETELASVTDNPLVVGDQVISAGHFHGEPVGLALDYLKIGISEFAAISERRSERALNSAYNRGLPAFLAGDPGLESGLMICQYTAAALVSENKVLSHPSCVDSITTGANQEDHVSMAMNAALHAQSVIENVARVLAIELIVMARALDCRKDLQPDEPGTGVRTALKAVRNQSPPITADRSTAEEIEQFDLEVFVADVEAEFEGLA